ncbi:MAG: hypothetical protein Q4D79_02890 [Propionibacteriaceae bacterium]|nr:hypothetical protein [Propionibacteriaceae bacterium]
MKQRVRTAFVTALLSFIAVLLPQPALGAPGQEERLPTPPEPPVNVPNYGTTVRPDGTPVAVVVPSAKGGMLNVVDLTTGTSTHHPLSTEDIDVQTWAFATLPDRSLLIGAAHHLFRYDPSKDIAESITQLSLPSQAGWTQVDGKFETIWDIAVDEAGTAYLSTNGKGKGVGAHILTWSQGHGWGLLPGGVPVTNAKYAQAIDYADGHVYVGTSGAQVLKVNVASGTKTEVPVSSGAQGNYEYLEVHGGWLYTDKLTERGTVAFNLETGELRDIGNFRGHFATRPGDPTRVYFAHHGETSGRWLYSYDPTAGPDAGPTPVLHDNNLRSRLSPLSFASADWFVSSEMHSGEVSVANLATGTVNLYPDLLTVGPRVIQSMAAAGDKLYASWYMTTAALLEVTPGQTTAETSYAMPDFPASQAESMVSDGDLLATGLYPGGTIRIQSLSKPDEAVTHKIGFDQDRPYAAISLGNGNFAFGSVPSSEKLGGALSVYRDKTLKTYPFRNLNYADGLDRTLLTDLAPISLAHRGDKIYMGTSKRGGHDTFAGTDEAYVVEFDLTQEKVTAITRVFEKQVAVTGLTVGADGVLYGITGQHVFSLIDGKVTGQRLTTRTEVNRSWMLERDGVLYAVVGGQLRAIPTGNMAAAHVIASSGPGDAWIMGLSLGADGYLYYAKGAELFRHSVLKG